jgi:two-component system response regulator AtoC
METVTAPTRAIVAARPRVLVIEDETLFARAVARSLEGVGYDVMGADSLLSGRQAMQAATPDLVLLDLRLPDGSGMDLLAELSALGDDRPQVLVLTAYGEIGDAVQAIKLGAADYLKKPIDLDELRLVVERVLATTQMRNQLDYSRERDSRAAVEGALLIGESPAIQRLKDQIHRLARLAAGTGEPPPTVLILGETGSGKDVAARLLHLSGPFRDQPFVQVDCASLPRDLIEAELFGHEKGAFTSAVGARAGLLEAAEDGTIFLDEIGELPLDLQAKLLNVIERRRTRRIGSVKERTIRARIMAGTNRDLPAMIAEGQFRPDLYYRLNVITLTVPPLRERGEDILTLARHFALQTARRYGLPPRSFSSDALAAISRYHWPGNVRELRHLVERAVLLSHDAVISAPALALNHTPQAMAEAFPLKGLTLEAAERMLIEQALQDTGGNVSQAARRLGVSRMTLRYRMDKYGFKDA